MTESQPFKGITFLFAGTLSTYSLVEAKSIVTENGGEVLTAVTSDLNYLVFGSDSSKELKMALEIGSVNLLSEDEFIEMLNQGGEVTVDEEEGDEIENHESESDDIDEELKRMLAEFGAQDEEEGETNEAEEDSTSESSGTDLTSFFMSRFGTNELVEDSEEQHEEETSLEDPIEAMLSDLDSAESSDGGEILAEERTNAADGPLDESIGAFTSYVDSIEQPSGMVLLSTFALVDIIMRENQLVDDEFYSAISAFVGWVHVQAYEWDNAEENGFLPEALLQQYLIQSKTLSSSYMEAVESGSASYRTFLKRIGVAGIGADLSPEERGDLSSYLLMFEHAVSRLFEDQFSAITRDIRATIEHIDCTELIGDLMGVA